MNIQAERKHALGRLVWPRLIPGMVLAGGLAWGTHVAMLEAFKIPYPADLPKTGVVAFLNYAASVLAVFGFYGLASPWFARLSPLWRCLGLSLLLVMLDETFRVTFIVGVITTAWTYSLVSNVQGVFPLALVGSAVALVAPRLTRLWHRMAAAFLIAAVVFFGFRPLVAALFKHFLDALASWSHDQIYPDTSWQLNLASLVGYTEPTIACFLMAALVWRRLSARPVWRAVQFALLIALIRGTLFTAFYYPFYAHVSAPTAMLSAGQFTLEWLTLGFLTALVWDRCRRSDGLSPVAR